MPKVFEGIERADPEPIAEAIAEMAPALNAAVLDIHRNGSLDTAGFPRIAPKTEAEALADVQNALAALAKAKAL